MIYTVTFNPAVDYVVKTDRLEKGKLNRSREEKMYFGGKGINVSRVLKALGFDSAALGFCAGFTGAAIEDGIRGMEIKTDFVHLKSGCSRINVKIKAAEETEINGQGPDITENDLSALLEKLDRLKEGDTLILAGSVPESLPKNIYEKILERLHGRQIKFVVDAVGELLLNVLKYKPFLIKPNSYELGELFGVEVKTKEEAVRHAEKLRKMGAVNVLVSMAKDGAVLIDEKGNVHERKAYDGTVVNSVGAGDSMIAGFIAGYNEKNDYSYALKLGTAAGSATAFSEDLADRTAIMQLMKD